MYSYNNNNSNSYGSNLELSNNYNFNCINCMTNYLTHVLFSFNACLVCVWTNAFDRGNDSST